MELETFLSSLNKVKKSGKGYVALCPAHDDQKHSLSVTLEGTKILVRCFVGCTAEAITESLGLELADLFTDRAKKAPQIVKAYDYTDETGNLLFQVCRLEPKSFRQRHKNGQGEWVWSMKGIRRVLYHLPHIIKAPEVYFVEGEKDADNLWDLGLVATTSPGGAKAWKPEYAECLAGKKVVLIPDNDEPGLAYARDIACALMGKAQLTCILLPGAKDVSDWLVKRKPTDKDAEIEQDAIGELQAMRQDISVLLGGMKAKYEMQDEAIIWHHDPVMFKAENIRRERTGLHGKATISHNYTPLSWSVFNLERMEERGKLASSAFKLLKPEIKNAYPEATLRKDFDIFCAGLWPFYLSHYSPDLIYGDEVPAPLTFFLKPYIMKGGGTILFAPPGRGKSNTGLLWAQSMNSGITKFWTVKQCPVLYINLERSRETMQRRLSGINRILGLPPVTPLRILNARGKSLSDVFDACRRAIQNFGIEVIILDSISRSGYGDLTENKPVNAIIDALSGLSSTWVALAHTPRVDETHIYGGVMFDAGADIVVKLSSAIASNGTLGLGYEITKANDIAYGKLKTYAMEFNEERGIVGFREAKPYEFPEIEGQVKKPMIQAITDYILEQDQGDATATEIADATGLNRGNVASVLRSSGQFVQTRKDGRNVYYGVRANHV